jgi:hypothetical protein
MGNVMQGVELGLSRPLVAIEDNRGSQDNPVDKLTAIGVLAIAPTASSAYAKI